MKAILSPAPLAPPLSPKSQSGSPHGSFIQSTSTLQSIDQKEAITSSSSLAFHYTAGLVSGLTSSLLLQPADLLKTRLQQHSPSSTTPNSLGAIFRSIYAQPHPLRTLWRGTLPSTLRTGIGSALYFGGLDQLRTLVLRQSAASAALSNGIRVHDNNSKKLSGPMNLLTGAVARAAAGFGVMPITVLKVRFESSLYSYRTLGAAIHGIYNEAPRTPTNKISSLPGLDKRKGGSIRGFFAGFGATAVRDAPYAGLYVFFYEGIKSRLLGLAASTGSTDDRKSTTTTNTTAAAVAVSTFTAGVIAAAAATAITNPCDAVKTRIQLQPHVYRHLVQAAGKMVREDGWRCLFDGLALRMGRKALSSALAWTVYEQLVRRAEQKLVVV